MTAPVHIMMTADAVGGVWVYALALSRRLAEAGYRVTVVTLGTPPDEAEWKDANALPASVEVIVTDLDLEWRDPEGRDIARSQAALLGLADQLRPDLVHVNGYREGSIPWQRPSVVVAHSCVMSWWEAVRREPVTEPRWLVYAQAVRKGLDAACVWVAPTQAFRQCIQRIYRPRTSGHVIANGVDFPALPTVAKEPFILASGRMWDSGKNLAALMEIAPRLPWPVCIAGAGMPDDAAAAPNIRWLGEIDHATLQSWMRRAAIYTAPAHYEPFGLAILEAARAGCALVLSDIATLRELWHGAALHVPPGKSGSLQSALTNLCIDDRTRNDLQRAAENRASAYSLDRTVGAYTELYGRLLARGERPKPSVAGPELAA